MSAKKETCNLIHDLQNDTWRIVMPEDFQAEVDSLISVGSICGRHFELFKAVKLAVKISTKIKG